MKDTVYYSRLDPDLPGAFRTGVCLHGHTMYSEECLWFLPRYLRAIPGAAPILNRYQRGPQPAVDFSRAYWTPPLSPISALRLEQQQIAGLGLRPFVSLTDHDTVEAGIGLQVAVDVRETPLSVEWTVPYRRTILHLGIHNLPPLAVRSWMRVLADFTASPDEARLPEILSELARIPEILIVLNHPFWLEEGVEESDHRPALDLFLLQFSTWIHAFEWNGTRRWKENSDVAALAEAHAMPLISGGDRHACEPSACLNLTNAGTFSEFAAEVRDGESCVLVMPHYSDPMTLRLLEAIWEVLRPYPEYPGRERWTDRFYYRGEDGVPATLAALWRDRAPLPLMPLTGVLPLFTTHTVRQALRFLLSRRTELQF